MKPRYSISDPQLRARDATEDHVNQYAPNEARLMDRVRARDPHALEELYQSYDPRLTRFLMRLFHRPRVVEEVINDTMMAVWNKPESFRETSTLSTWIFAIAYRQALKTLRHSDQAVEDLSAHSRISEEAGPDEPLKRERVRHLLLEAIEQLSEDHRGVIKHAYFQEMGYQEIAELMACPVSTVKTRMFHARRELRRILAGSVEEWL
jgi:RNA polymerase sigma factor (sigma-70 family)